jgi:hypothetical protein
LGEMLKGWYGRHMPFWLEPVADSLYMPSASAQKYSDAELGQFLMNMHFWQHHLPDDSLVVQPVKRSVWDRILEDELIGD